MKPPPSCVTNHPSSSPLLLVGAGGGSGGADLDLATLGSGGVSPAVLTTSPPQPQGETKPRRRGGGPADCSRKTKSGRARQLSEEHLSRARELSGSGAAADVIASFVSSVACAPSGAALFEMSLALAAAGELPAAERGALAAGRLQGSLRADAAFQLGVWRSQGGDVAGQSREPFI